MRVLSHTVAKAPFKPMAKRRIHTPEFKAQVALDALSSKKTLAEIAADYKLHPVQVCQWKRQAAKHLADIFRHPNSTFCAEATESLSHQLTQLEQTNTTLRGELDWLKKKFYSYDQPMLRSLLEPDHQCISLRQQCKLIGVTRSSYYYHPVIIGSKRRELAHLIDRLCEENPYISGRSMLANLHSQGQDICKNQLQRLLCCMGFAPFERKLIKQFGHRVEQVPALPMLQEDKPRAGEQWIVDIAYWPAQKMDQFAALLVDACSMKCLSWGLADSLSPDLVTSVLRVAMEKHPLPLILRSETFLPYLSQRCLGSLQQEGISLARPLWLNRMEGSGRATVLTPIWTALKQWAQSLQTGQSQANEECLLHQAISHHNGVLNSQARKGKTLPGQHVHWSLAAG
jgi:putative transposase